MERGKKNVKRTRNKNNSSHIINSKLKRRTNQYKYVLPSFLVLNQNKNLLTVISLLLFCIVSQCEGSENSDLDPPVYRNRNHRLHRHSEPLLQVDTADSSHGHLANDR